MYIRIAGVKDAFHIAKVHIDTWQTTYSGIVPQDYLHHLSYKESETTWIGILNNRKDTDFIYVAENNFAQIIGFIWGGRNRVDNSAYVGELCGIYILDTYQQQGIGKRLVQIVAKDFFTSGILSMSVEVLAQNSAHRFYEQLGGNLVGQRKIDIGGSLLEVLTYGWQDIRVLL